MSSNAAQILILFTYELMFSFCCSMATAIKEIVSKNKKRFKDSSFDLDLSYITNRIIAMGYPAEALERLYRNSIEDVVKFFETRHKGAYKIYNLCSEVKRNYDPTKFHGPVDKEYSFQDHNPPPFHILKPFCENVHRWVTADPNNIVAVHCKAGKGRTGLMICAYLIHASVDRVRTEKNVVFLDIPNAKAALDFYGLKRTHDGKGVTIPSQRRYVYYYEELVKRQLEYRKVSLRLSKLILTSIPVSFLNCSYTLVCEIYSIPKQKIIKLRTRVNRGAREVVFNLPQDLILIGDVKFEFYAKKLKKMRLFEFCLNTFFIEKGCTESRIYTTVRCAQCNLEKVSMHDSPLIERKSMDPDESTVIDMTIVHSLIDDKSSCNCDLLNPTDLAPRNSTARHSNDDSISSVSQASMHNNEDRVSIHNNIVKWNSGSVSENGSIPVASTSTALSSGSKISTPVSSKSLSSSESNLPSTSKSLEKNRDLKNLFVVMPKEKLDKAYKDKSNKKFRAGFKAVLEFSKIDLDGGTTNGSVIDTEICSEAGAFVSETNVNFENNSDHKQVYTFSDSVHKKGKFRLSRLIY